MSRNTISRSFSIVSSVPPAATTTGPMAREKSSQSRRAVAISCFREPANFAACSITLYSRETTFRRYRAGRPFVGISAAAIPGQLLESELFGYVKGAFTDAGAPAGHSWSRPMAAASSSTRSATCRPELQVKLLRALEARTLRAWGPRLPPLDVRVVAATHRDLEACARRRFRQDLYYRLEVVSLSLPALRDRRTTSRSWSSASSRSTPTPSASG